MFGIFFLAFLRFDNMFRMNLDAKGKKTNFKYSIRNINSFTPRNGP